MIHEDVVTLLDTLAFGVVVSMAVYRSIDAVWIGDWIGIWRVLEVLVAFVVAIVGANLIGQHLWAG